MTNTVEPTMHKKQPTLPCKLRRSFNMMDANTALKKNQNNLVVVVHLLIGLE